MDFPRERTLGDEIRMSGKLILALTLIGGTIVAMFVDIKAAQLLAPMAGVAVGHYFGAER